MWVYNLQRSILQRWSQSLVSHGFHCDTGNPSIERRVLFLIPWNIMGLFWKWDSMISELGHQWPHRFSASPGICNLCVQHHNVVRTKEARWRRKNVSESIFGNESSGGFFNSRPQCVGYWDGVGMKCTCGISTTTHVTWLAKIYFTIIFVWMSCHG